MDNQIIDRTKISGASDHQEALEAAEECCDENNCILGSMEFEKLQELPDVEKVTWPVLWAEMPVYWM